MSYRCVDYDTGSWAMWHHREGHSIMMVKHVEGLWRYLEKLGKSEEHRVIAEQLGDYLAYVDVQISEHGVVRFDAGKVRESEE